MEASTVCDTALDTLIQRLLTYRPRRQPAEPVFLLREQVYQAIMQLPTQEQVALRGAFGLDGHQVPQRVLMQQLGLAKTAQVVKVRDQGLGRLYDQLLLPPQHPVGLWVQHNDAYGFTVDYLSPRVMRVRYPVADLRGRELLSSTGGIDNDAAVELVEPLDWEESERRARHLDHPPLCAEALARLAPLTDAPAGDALLQEVRAVAEGCWLATERVALLQLVVCYGRDHVLVQASAEALLACVAAEEDARTRVAALEAIEGRTSVLSKSQQEQLRRIAQRLLYEASWGDDTLTRIAGRADMNAVLDQDAIRDEIWFHQCLQGQLHKHLSTIAQGARGRGAQMHADTQHDPVVDAARLFEHEKRRPLSMLRSLFEPRVSWRDYATVQRLLALAFCRVAEQAASSARDLALESLPIGEVGTAAFRIAANGTVYLGYGSSWSYEDAEPLAQWAHDSVAALFYLASAFYDAHGRDTSLEQALKWATAPSSTNHWPRFESSRQRATAIEPWLRKRFSGWLEPGA